MDYGARGRLELPAQAMRGVERAGWGGHHHGIVDREGVIVNGIVNRRGLYLECDDDLLVVDPGVCGPRGGELSTRGSGGAAVGPALGGCGMAARCRSQAVQIGGRKRR